MVGMATTTTNHLSVVEPHRPSGVRFTPDDMIAIRSTIQNLVQRAARGRPRGEFTVNEEFAIPVIAAAVGCTVADLRDEELAVIERELFDAWSPF